MTNEIISNNFIKNIIVDDLETGKHDHIITRFPPEPNGYLHIGHAKSICLNFCLAKEFKGTVNMRFDDTNPLKEDEEYVNSIKEDVQWLGFNWNNLYFASDYFDEMYERAILLIKKGKAFVCDLTAEEIAAYYGDDTVYNYVHPNNHRMIAFLRKRGYTVLNLIEIRKPYQGEMLTQVITVGEHEFDY